MNIPILFGSFLIREEIISKDDLKEVIKVQTEIKHSFGVIAINNDIISTEDLKKGREYQNINGVTLEKALVELKIIK